LPSGEFFHRIQELPRLSAYESLGTHNDQGKTSDLIGDYHERLSGYLRKCRSICDTRRHSQGDQANLVDGRMAIGGYPPPGPASDQRPPQKSASGAREIRDSRAPRSKEPVWDQATANYEFRAVSQPLTLDHNFHCMKRSAQASLKAFRPLEHGRWVATADRTHSSRDFLSI
jgi:hypothetical protein